MFVDICKLQAIPKSRSTLHEMLKEALQEEDGRQEPLSMRSRGQPGDGSYIGK